MKGRGRAGNRATLFKCPVVFTEHVQYFLHESEFKSAPWPTTLAMRGGLFFVQIVAPSG